MDIFYKKISFLVIINYYLCWNLLDYKCLLFSVYGILQVIKIDIIIAEQMYNEKKINLRLVYRRFCGFNRMYPKT